jgi:L-lactate dehydrogenase complex protein LldF
VYERAGGHAYGSVYPGPIGAILTPMLRGVGEDAATDSLPYASSLCGACFEVCPVAIDIPEVLVHLRGQVVDAHRTAVPTAIGLAMKGAAWTFASQRRLAAAERLSALSGWVAEKTSWRRSPSGDTLVGRLPWPGSYWTDARDAPAPATESFRHWWNRTGGGRADTGPTDTASAPPPDVPPVPPRAGGAA